MTVANGEPLDSGEVEREVHLLRCLQAQTDYSSSILTECERLLTAVRRVDQKYGPYEEFTPWRDKAQG